MLGVDLYDRYQDVTDWAKVRDAGVRFCYIKGTDGGSRAPVRADAFVAGARTVGIPVGLYHYAQLTPAPETQADVLHAEVTRLGATGLPPALDFESTVATTLTGAQGAEFCRRFLARLRERGHRRVTLYANTSHLAKIGAPSLAASDANLLIWAARYGANDGVTYPGLGGYAGRVDIHQWTDRGSLPGITSAGLDLNRALTNILNTEDDMSWTEELTSHTGHTATAATWLIATNDKVDRLAVKLDALAGQLRDDEANIISAVRDIVAADQAAQVAITDEQVHALAARLADALPAGVTEAQMQDAVRRAFARAGAPA